MAGKASLVETLALEGIGKGLKLKNWAPSTMLKQLGQNPEEFRLNWGKIALATAIWMQAVTSTLNPILMYFQYKKDKKMSPQERRMLIAQETAKQFVHLCLHVGVMIIGVTIAKKKITGKVLALAKQDAAFAAKVMKKDPKTGLETLDRSLIANYETSISNIAGCLAGAVMLPILGATLFKAMDKRLGLTGEKSHEKTHVDLKQALNKETHFDELAIAPLHPNGLKPQVIAKQLNLTSEGVPMGSLPSQQAPQPQPAFAGRLQQAKSAARMNAFQTYNPNPLVALR